MEKTNQLVSNFIKSLENHPSGANIIEIIQRILADESGDIDSSLISELKRLSNNNLSLLIEFWLLRGCIQKEEGKGQESLQTFLEALQWRDNDVITLVRIADIFKSNKELIRASFFLLEAQKLLGSDSTIIDEYNKLLEELRITMTIPPGLTRDNIRTLKQFKYPVFFLYPASEESISLSQSKTLSKQLKKVNFPPAAKNVWNQALECYEEAFKTDNLIYLQAFIHYVHSTVSKILELNGNFKTGLEQKVAQYGLFEFEAFFKRLNNLRNAVVHESYIPSKEQAKNIHEQVIKLFDIIQK